MSENKPQYLLNALARTDPSNHHIVERCNNKGIRAAANVCVGAELKVRTSKKTVQTGNILAARVHRLHVNRCSIYPVYEVDLECGFDKVFKQVYVDSIPYVG
jgi:hypothetical protein